MMPYNADYVGGSLGFGTLSGCQTHSVLSFKDIFLFLFGKVISGTLYSSFSGRGTLQTHHRRIPSVAGNRIFWGNGSSEWEMIYLVMTDRGHTRLEIHTHTHTRSVYCLLSGLSSFSYKHISPVKVNMKWQLNDFALYLLWKIYQSTSLLFSLSIPQLLV